MFGADIVYSCGSRIGSIDSSWVSWRISLSIKCSWTKNMIFGYFISKSSFTRETAMGAQTRLVLCSGLNGREVRGNGTYRFFVQDV